MSYPEKFSKRSWQNNYLTRFYPQSSWPGQGTKEFFALCKQYCSGEILEVGPGPSNPCSDYFTTLGTLHGVDIDPEVISNSALRSAHVIASSFPFASNTFDSCISTYVCEHLTNPEEHINEVFRVLKPGGVYVLRTPNRFHYTALGARMTPHAIHLKYANRLRVSNDHEPYHTCYLMNSKREISRLAEQAGFEIEYVRLVETEPSYGLSSRALFFTFMLYERIVNSSDLFSNLRSNLFVVLRK